MSYRTIMRVLGAIPTSGWHSTASIHARVADGGHEMTKRSVERLLRNLAEEPDAPIESQGGESQGRAKEWRWRRHHPLQRHAHREAEFAQTLLLHRMARHLLPPVMAKRLDEEERRARSELARNPDGDMAWWLDHVAALPPGPRRYPLPIAAGVFEAVSEALWKRRQLNVEYRSRGKSDWRSFTVHPQGLVQDGYLLYLVGSLFDYDNPVHLALMRMRNAEVLMADARKLPGFSLKQQVEEQFEWPYEPTQPTEFWIHAERKIELEELPIAPDQRIDPIADHDGFHRVTATVASSMRLDAFLMSFGDELHRGEKD